MRRNLLVLALLGIAATALAQGQLLSGLESLEGLKIGFGVKIADSKLELNTDPRYVSEGKASVRVSTVAHKEGATSNGYVSVLVPCAPVDMTGKVLVFDTWTSTPEAIKGFYVRGFNAKNEPVLSWMNWAPVLKASQVTFRLTPGANSSGLKWEQAFIKNSDITAVVKWEFVIGTPTEGAPLDLYLDKVRAEAAGQAPAVAPPASPTPTPAARPAGGVIYPCETTDGVALTWLVPGAKVSLNTDPRYLSEGKGSLRAEGKAPADAKGNSYVGLSFATAPVDLRGQALTLDTWTSTPEMSRGFYVRGFNAAKQCVASWQTWSGPLKSNKVSFTLTPGVSETPMAWEAEEIKNPDLSAVVRWEIIVGCPKAGADFDLFVDNLRLAPNATRSFAAVTEPRKLLASVTLAQAGQPQAIIVAPREGGEWAKLATEIAAAIKQATGAVLPIKTDDQVTLADLSGGNAILLGNVINNRAFLYPYTHWMTFADGLYPGEGGYEVRTACDPWATGKGLVIIGATDLAGAKAGVAAFAKRLKPGADLAVAQMLEAKLGGEAEGRWGGWFTQPLDDAWVTAQRKSAEQGLVEGVHTGLFGAMASIGLQYCITGREGYARHFAWLAERAAKHVQSKPTTYGGPWGMDSDFMVNRVMPAWGVVEECPALAGAQRLAVAKILFQWVSEACVGKALGTMGNEHVRHNHQTFPALGCLFAGQYFSRYYDAAEGKRWIDVADGCFQFQMKCFKSHEDCNGYQWLTLGHTVRYALSRPDLTFFENGNCRRIADYAMLVMNNLGYQVPYGDTGEWKCWFSEVPVLRAAEWYYRDGRYQWALDRKAVLRDPLILGDLAGSFPTKEPVDLVGARAWPLDPYFYKSFAKADAPPQAQAFDKVSFRNSLDPQDQYLLLDGLSNGGHRHMDGNSLEQWTEKGHVWLADADYIKSLPKYHNGVLILRDGQSATIPDFCEMERMVDLPSVGVSTTVLRKYAGVDWHRNVLWLKGRFFVVVDQMAALQDGDYSFRNIWQTVGSVDIKDGGLDIDQKGQFARFAMTPDTQCQVNDDLYTGKNWSSYPFAEKPIVRVFQGITNRALKAGQTASIFTVLHASGEQPSGARVIRLTDNVSAITGAGEPVIVAIGDREGRISLPGMVEGIAAAAIVTPQKAYGIGVREIAFEGRKQTFPQAVDIEVNLAAGEATIKAPSATTAGARQQTLRLPMAQGAEPQEIRALIETAIRTAPAVRPATSTLPEVPQLARQWTYGEKISSYLLTNNGGAFEAVDAGVKITGDTAPLAHNVFSGDNTNTLDNLTDGETLTTDGGVMWANDQAVTLNVAFNNVYDLSRLDLLGWFVTSSSKGNLFQIGRIQVSASNDNFKQDNRTLVDFKDTEQYGNWGAPSHEPHRYGFDNLKAKAQYLRIVITPRPGTALYLGELQVWGNRPGLSIDLATRVQRGIPVHLFKTLKAADIDGDKQDEILAGSTNGNLYCLDAKGNLRWKFECGGPVNSVNTVDFAGDGKLTIVAGITGAKLFALDAMGKQLWVFSPPYYKRAAHIRTVFPADLEGKGKQVAIAGSDNWHYYAVDASGKEIWNYESVHGSTAGCAADLDGDGRQEIVAGTEYYWWHCINPDGKMRWGYSTTGGPCANAVAAGNLLGDGKREAIFGGADAILHVLSQDGKLLWTFNTGDEVTAVQCIDVNGDGKDEVLASSLSFNLYCLDGQGKVLWRRDLGSEVTTMTAFKSGAQTLVAAGGDRGDVYLFNGANGKLVYRTQAAGGLKALSSANIGGKPTLLISSGDGNLQTVTLP